MPGINMLHANSKTEALLAIAKRCHAQGLHAEADRWRECAFLYAAGEGIDGDGMTSYISSSDAPSVLGVSPWKSQFMLYQEKTCAN